MAALTFYLANTATAAGYGTLTTTAPSAASMTTGWTVAKLAADNYSRLKYGTKQASGSFSTTNPLATASAPTTTNDDAFVSSDPLLGTFDAGTWTFTFNVRPTTASAQQGAVLVRLWRGTNPDGTGATQITSAVLTGSTTTGTPSTGANSTSTVTWTPGTTITLTNEYLFVQIAWQIVTASGANNGDWVLRTDSTLVTPNFTLGTITATVGATENADVAIVRTLLDDPGRRSFLFSTTGAFTHTVPADATAVDILTWGGGGGGQGGGWSGGGGAFAKVTGLSVTPGQTIYGNVGAGGTGQTGNVIASTAGVGKPSWVNIASNAKPTTTSQGALAPGGYQGTYEQGSDGTTRIGGSGGNVNVSLINNSSLTVKTDAAVGTTIYNGGSRDPTNSSTPSAAGGGAGSQAAGSNSSGTTPGAGGALEGGSGGTYAASGTAGNGSALGGGGGGADWYNSLGTGGSGANGQVLLTYTVSTSTTLSLTATEAKDTAAITTAAYTQAALSATEATDSASLTAAAYTQAALSATEATDTAAVTTAAYTQAAFSATEATDTAEITTDARTSASLSTTEAPDTAAVTLGTLRPASATLATAATVTASALVIAYIRPSSDVSTGSWTTQTGGTTNLYATIDETAPADDADYIRSPALTAGQSNAYTTQLAANADPANDAAHIVRYRARASGTISGDLTVSLKQGSTVIASWSHTNVPADWTTYESALTLEQAGAISDYANLSLTFNAAA